MNAYVAVTDLDWFDFLSDLSLRTRVDEVNFWMPKPWGGRFGVLTDGQPLLFKLKSPRNAIGGGGFFRHYTELPLSRAWETFGPLNGAPTHSDTWRRITRLRREDPRPWDDPVIGCILLAEPFFWPEEDWIRDVPGWHPNMQRGRGYDLQTTEGRALWDAVVERMQRQVVRSSGVGEGAQIDVFGGYGAPALRPTRLGQGTFRALVTDAYGRRCAVTDEKALPALEAAHIRPFQEARGHSLKNGILLRSDVHRLFDAGYVTVTPEHRLEASRRMRDDFDDGDTYLSLHGTFVRVPESPDARPDPEALRWHNEERYRG